MEKLMNLELTANEVNIVMIALQELQFKIAAPVFSKIEKQIVAQVENKEQLIG